MQTSHSASGCLANYIVIALIPVLFFLTMILGYINIININVPIHSLAIIGFILFVFLLFIKHNANYSVCKMRLSHMQLTIDLNAELSNKSLTIEENTKSVLDVEKFLNAYYSDVRNDNFASVASSIFPMLGILGTFVAIALSMPNFSVSDTKALDHEISMLLSGVGSAFFASIYGILLSLIWTYFEKRGLSKVRNYFSSISQDFADKVWSKEELLIYKYTQYDSKENKFIAALKETFSIDFMLKLNEQHLHNFKSVMHTTNDNFTNITTHLEKVSKELNKTLKDVNVSNSALNAQQAMDSALQEFTTATASFEKTSRTHSAQLNRTFEKIDVEIGQIVVKLADFATHVSLESKEVQESISKYHTMIARQLKEK